MAYTKRLGAIDPLVGEAFALTEVVVLAHRHLWCKAVFECHSLILCKEVLLREPPQCWEIEQMTEFIRRGLEEHRDWKIAWIPWKCNRMAHNLAKWATTFGGFGISVGFVILEHIQLCDMRPS